MTKVNKNKDTRIIWETWETTTGVMVQNKVLSSYKQVHNLDGVRSLMSTEYHKLPCCAG